MDGVRTGFEKMREHAHGELPIPDDNDWGFFPEDLDWVYAHKVFFGKNMEQTLPLFHENPIERTDELRFMPPVPFRYYMRAFARYVTSEQAMRSDDASDAASCFIRLFLEKLEDGKDSVTPELYAVLLPAARHVAAFQDKYGADKDIYGDFSEICARITSLIKIGQKEKK